MKLRSTAIHSHSNNGQLSSKNLLREGNEADSKERQNSKKQISRVTLESPVKHACKECIVFPKTSKQQSYRAKGTSSLGNIPWEN